LEHLSEHDKEHYLSEAENKFTEVMDGERLRIELGEKLVQARLKLSRQRKHGPQTPVHLKSVKRHHHHDNAHALPAYSNHTIIAELDPKVRHNIHDAKKLICVQNKA